MEGSAGTALARLAVAQIDPIGFTCCNYSERAAVALPDPLHSLLQLGWPHFDRSCGLPSSRFEQKGHCRVDQESAAKANRVRSGSPLEY
jgi:hypothetical protein